MNDNQPRTPAEHRAIVAQQATSGEANYRGGTWPTGRRLRKAGSRALLMGIAQWQIDNAMPRLSAANDNTVEKNQETTRKDAVDADEIMAAIELEKEHPGEYWRPETLEVFVRDRWMSVKWATEREREHSAAAPDWLADNIDPEDQTARTLDAQRIRERLGIRTCAILDAAASDATAEEIAMVAECGRKDASNHVDAAIQKYLQIAA